MAFSTVLAIVFFLIIPTYGAKFIPGVADSAFRLNVVEGILRLLIFLLYIWAISLTKDIQRVFEYHGGFALKENIKGYLQEEGIEFTDYGTLTPERCDYPVIAKKVAEAVADGTFDRGILICGTGIGIGIAANKVHGIRAALCHENYIYGQPEQHRTEMVCC